MDDVFNEFLLWLKPKTSSVKLHLLRKHLILRQTRLTPDATPRDADKNLFPRTAAWGWSVGATYVEMRASHYFILRQPASFFVSENENILHAYRHL